MLFSGFLFFSFLFVESEWASIYKIFQSVHSFESKLMGGERERGGGGWGGLSLDNVLGFFKR